eukprot:964012-Rhodomonas_salina.4
MRSLERHVEPYYYSQASTQLCQGTDSSESFPRCRAFLCLGPYYSTWDLTAAFAKLRAGQLASLQTRG